MSWLRIDDGFTEHYKLVGLKRSERWTWLEVLTFCARSGNGSIPRGISDVLKHVTTPFLRRCVDLGLIDETPSGMEVHDWELYNPKDPLKAGRQARWRDRKASTPPSTPPSTPNGPVDDLTVYENVYRDGAPSPSPTPAHSGSSSVSYIPPSIPVVPDGEDGFEQGEELIFPGLRDFPEPDPWE
jgi:hypothetical protein